MNRSMVDPTDPDPSKSILMRWSIVRCNNSPSQDRLKVSLSQYIYFSQCLNEIKKKLLVLLGPFLLSLTRSLFWMMACLKQGGETLWE